MARKPAPSKRKRVVEMPPQVETKMPITTAVLTVARLMAQSLGLTSSVPEQLTSPDAHGK